MKDGAHMKANFRCTRKSGTETFTIVLEPVNVPTDRSFFRDWPDGNITLWPITAEAGALFVEGGEVTIEFSEPGVTPARL